jgi:hypothetical protein
VLDDLDQDEEALDAYRRADELERGG